MRSAIFVPIGTSTAPAELFTLMRNDPLRTTIKTLCSVAGAATAPALRMSQKELLASFEDEDIDGVADLVARELGFLAPAEMVDEALESIDEQSFRLAEAQAMLVDRLDPDLTVRRTGSSGLSAPFSKLLSGVSLVDRLRVTKAFLGFSRLGGMDEEAVGGSRVRRDLLWRGRPGNWLPAALVFGEGILLEFDADRIADWARRPGPVERCRALTDRFETQGGRRSSVVAEVTPEYVALHTLAHLIVLELAFFSGYSATSMSERVYVDRASGTYAVLLYTAAGDTEGTMGGLVRLGRDDRLDVILQRAIERAEWCSIDPVCTELGDEIGQGPNACNMAACYACAVVPETTCDDFNRFLDRGMLVGPGVGLLEHV